MICGPGNWGRFISFTGPVAQKLYNTLYGMQTGTVADDMGWTVKL